MTLSKTLSAPHHPLLCNGDNKGTSILGWLRERRERTHTREVLGTGGCSCLSASFLSLEEKRLPGGDGACLGCWGMGNNSNHTSIFVDTRCDAKHFECIVCFNPRQPYEAFIFFYLLGGSWGSGRGGNLPQVTQQRAEKNFLTPLLSLGVVVGGYSYSMPSNFLNRHLNLKLL